MATPQKEKIIEEKDLEKQQKQEMYRHSMSHILAMLGNTHKVSPPTSPAAFLFRQK